MFVGIDVGAKRLDLAAVDAGGRVVDIAVFAASDIGPAIACCRGAEVVAIDAPAALSTAPHAGDVTLAPKFRAARCAEIDLGRRHRLWVPWVAPLSGAPVATWMAVGLALFAALPAAIEVYPYAAFRRLAGTRLPSKLTPAGRAARAELLGLDASRIGHHALDAVVAARVARDHACRRAEAATCGHDGSSIWLPAA